MKKEEEEKDTGGEQNETKREIEREQIDKQIDRQITFIHFCNLHHLLIVAQAQPHSVPRGGKNYF